MSKSAMCFLMLALVACGLDILLPSEHVVVHSGLEAIAIISGVLLVISLVIGRKIKFDPMLR